MYTESYSKELFHDELTSVFHDLMEEYALNISESSNDGYDLYNGKINILLYYYLGEIVCSITCKELGLLRCSSTNAYYLLFPQLDFPESFGDPWIPINSLIWHEKLVSKIMTKL